MSIRIRLLLLVFAVWLPAVAGLGLLARATYLREADAARQHIQQLAQSLSFIIDREIDKRAVMAKALGALSAIGDGDLARFHAEAKAATEGTGSWAFLVDRDAMLVNTLWPSGDAPPLRRQPNRPMVSGEPQVFFSPSSLARKVPSLGVYAPAGGGQPPRFNVGVAFEPAVIQGIVDQHTYPRGSVAAVIDRDQRVMARSREPAKWLGSEATGELRRRAIAGESGFVQTTTLDGVPSISYLSPANHYGWAVVIALPQSALTGAARRVSGQVITASAVLLLIGLGLALYAARRISQPIVALRDAAMQLGRDSVPPKLATGVLEADDVSLALHEAGRRQLDATRTLEQRVAQAVQQAEHAQAQLLEGQKHEAIGRLTGGLAHDFNNLLQTICTGLQVMERTTVDGSQRRVLQAALRASAKATDLVRQMLTFGRAQPLKPQPVDLRDFVLRSQEFTSKAVGGRVHLSASIEPGLAPVFVDPMQLELALLNLVFNARDALAGSTEAGQVRIQCRWAEPAEVQALGTQEPQGGGRFVCVEVVDNGPGMDAATLSRAFEPYFTTKPVGAGNGLGLPQVLAFARQSGGDIRLISEPGTGTRACLFLPACDAAVQPEPAESAPALEQRPLRVLMVEDDVLVASVVAPALEAMGHTVVLCANADQAQPRLASGQSFDVLFTDVVMPGALSGIDLVHWCEVHRPTLPTVITSGFAPQHADFQGVVLRKPYAIDELLAALQQAVASSPGAGSDG